MTSLGLYGGPRTTQATIGPKAAAGLPPFGFRIPDFDVWQKGYAAASVVVVVADTTTQASLFADPQLTTPIENPVTLLTMTDANLDTYGKWPQPVYAYQPYFLSINNTQQTGIERPPLIALDGENASLAIVYPRRGQYGSTLADITDWQIDVRQFGAWSTDLGASDLTAVLNLAIGAAAAQGGGYVNLPSESVAINPTTLPQGVVLRGSGATVLRCLSTGAIFTLGGDGAGFENITLDGVNVVSNSIGVDGTNIAKPVFRNVTIRRFALGLRLKGVPAASWDNLTISECAQAGQLRGDADAVGSNDGTSVLNLLWRGGAISANTTSGLTLECKDQLVEGVLLEGLTFSGNIGAALGLIGVRGLRAASCYWSENLISLNVQDGSDISQTAINTTQGIEIVGGLMNGGTAKFNGTCDKVRFVGTDIKNVGFTLSVPTNPILLVDCTTDSLVSYAGDTSKILRQRTSNNASVVGTTTDGSALTAWKYTLPPGSTCLVEAKIIARRLNGTETARYWLISGAERPGAALAYSGASVNFTVGDVLSGGTSLASARILAKAEVGTAGTLTLADITGTFIAGEALTATSGGAATVATAATFSNAALDAAGTTEVRVESPVGSAYAATIDASGSDVRVRVTGAASNNVAWLVEVQITVP